MSGTREKIFARIREALRSNRPFQADAPTQPHDSAPHAPPFRAWLPPVGETFAAQVALFARQSELLRTEFRECLNASQAAAHLQSLGETNGWKRLGVHAGKLTETITTHLSKSIELLPVDAGYDKNALEQCDAGLSECEVLVAQTGSICVSTRSSGGRALSVLPPHHIVVAHRRQLVPDLTSAFAFLAQKYRGGYPSFLSFISGPSRTGDIERILVLGAHGPKRLTVLLLPELPPGSEKMEPTGFEPVTS